MLVCELGPRLNKDIKLQIRRVSTDELEWEGYACELNSKSFHGATCIPDFIIPGGTTGEKFYPDFTIYFHYDDEYPQTILSREAVKRLFPWDTDMPGAGVATGYGKITNEGGPHLSWYKNKKEN